MEYFAARYWPPEILTRSGSQLQDTERTVQEQVTQLAEQESEVSMAHFINACFRSYTA